MYTIYYPTSDTNEIQVCIKLREKVCLTCILSRERCVWGSVPWDKVDHEFTCRHAQRFSPPSFISKILGLVVLTRNSFMALKLMFHMNLFNCLKFYFW